MYLLSCAAQYAILLNLFWDYVWFMLKIWSWCLVGSIKLLFTHLGANMRSFAPTFVNIDKNLTYPSLAWSELSTLPLSLDQQADVEPLILTYVGINNWKIHLPEDMLYNNCNRSTLKLFTWDSHFVLFTIIESMCFVYQQIYCSLCIILPTLVICFFLSTYADALLFWYTISFVIFLGKFHGIVGEMVHLAPIQNYMG